MADIVQSVIEYRAVSIPPDRVLVEFEEFTSLPVTDPACLRGLVDDGLLLAYRFHKEERGGSRGSKVDPGKNTDDACAVAGLFIHFTKRSLCGCLAYLGFALWPGPDISGRVPNGLSKKNVSIRGDEHSAVGLRLRHADAVLPVLLGAVKCPMLQYVFRDLIACIGIRP
jgi:hypothetical protein